MKVHLDEYEFKTYQEFMDSRKDELEKTTGVNHQVGSLVERIIPLQLQFNILYFKLQTLIKEAEDEKT